MSPIPYTSGTYNTVTHKVVPKDAIVLDLRAATAHMSGGLNDLPGLVTDLRRGNGGIFTARIAEQIEAQKPRIPEPGMWGVVEASTKDDPDRRKFGRVPSEGDDADQWTESYDEVWRSWSDLIDPVLIRDGIEAQS